MAAQVYDVIVVGAGIEGSSTAYNLAKRGQNTLLLEQFPLPHNRGSSHGATRITRRAYSQDYYTAMMKDGFKLWKELEQESGTKLYHNCGLLQIGTPVRLSPVDSALKKNSAPYRMMSLEDIQKDFPSINLPTDYIGVYDNDGGLLLSNKALRAFQDEFRRNGGTIRDGECVIDVIPGDVVSVKTTNGSFMGRNIVLALGPYTNILLDNLGLKLPLRTERISVFYWKEKVPGMHSIDKFPCFYDSGGASGLPIYALPSFEYPGLVKICLHAGPIIDPNNRDDCDSGWVRDRMCKYISERMPWLECQPAIEDVCIYTLTPDEDFVLDRHPQYANIIIAAGFSGHGFKLAPVVGKILSDLVLNQTPAFDMSHFKIPRFSKPMSQKTSRL